MQADTDRSHYAMPDAFLISGLVVLFGVLCLIRTQFGLPTAIASALFANYLITRAGRIQRHRAARDEAIVI